MVSPQEQKRLSDIRRLQESAVARGAPLSQTEQAQVSKLQGEARQLREQFAGGVQGRQLGEAFRTGQLSPQRARELGFSQGQIDIARARQTGVGLQEAIAQRQFEFKQRREGATGQALQESLTAQERGQALAGQLTIEGRLQPKGVRPSVIAQQPEPIVRVKPLEVQRAQTTQVVSVGVPTGEAQPVLESRKIPTSPPLTFEQVEQDFRPFFAFTDQPTKGAESLEQVRQSFNKVIFGGRKDLFPRGESPVEFEKRVLTPAIETFFEVNPQQRAEAERIRQELKQRIEAGESVEVQRSQIAKFFGVGEQRGLTVKELKSEKRFEDVFAGGVSVLSRPLTEVAPFLATGGGFVAAEQLVLKGITKVPSLLEFATSPAGKVTGRLIKGGLITAFVAGETAKVVTSEEPFVELGKSIVQTPVLFAGARTGGEVFELPVVRESGFGSPSRRIEEVRGIKSITQESLEEAFRTAKTPVSPEVRRTTVVQLQTELREASDVVAKLRGRFKLAEREITPEFLRQNIKGGISKVKAVQTVRTLQKFAPELFLKGSITQRTREFGDIDVAVNERLKGVFESAVKKAGVGFDVKTLVEGRQTATAQIEPLQAVGFRVGKKVVPSRETGVIEQLSRKVEGSIRFATGQEGGETRAKDILDVFGLRKSIEQQRRLPVSAFERLPETQRIMTFERTIRRPVVSERSLQPSRMATRSELSRGQTPRSIERSLRSVLRSSKPSVSPSRSFVPSPSISPSISKSVSPSPSPSPSPSVSPSISPSLSPSVSRSFSRSFSPSPSISPSIVRPPKFTGFKTPSLVGEPIFNLENLGKVETKFKPSLFGITLGKRIKVPPVGRTFGGFEVRGVPTGQKLGGLFEAVSKRRKKSRLPKNLL